MGRGSLAIHSSFLLKFDMFLATILKMAAFFKIFSSPFYLPSSTTTTYQILLTLDNIEKLTCFQWLFSLSFWADSKNSWFTISFAILNYLYIPNFIEIGIHWKYYTFLVAIWKMADIFKIPSLLFDSSSSTTPLYHISLTTDNDIKVWGIENCVLHFYSKNLKPHLLLIPQNIFSLSHIAKLECLGSSWNISLPYHTILWTCTKPNHFWDPLWTSFAARKKKEKYKNWAKAISLQTTFERLNYRI